MNKYMVEINGRKTDLKDLEALNFPETINSIRLDFQTSEPQGINTLAFFVLLTGLIEKIKNKTEYTLLLENLLNACLLVKKLEIDAKLGDDKY